MNKKLAIISILVVFALVSISTVSALNAKTSSEKKVSPLFSVRKDRQLNKNVKQKVVEFIKARTFVSFPRLIESMLSQRELIPTWYTEGIGCMTCWPNKC